MLNKIICLSIVVVRFFYRWLVIKMKLSGLSPTRLISQTGRVSTCVCIEAFYFPSEVFETKFDYLVR